MCDRHKEQMMLLGIYILCALSGVAWCDYKCICNYIAERDVYSTPSNESDILGYMYEFDCKPVVTSDDSWITLAFEHKLGYVADGDGLNAQTCPGEYPDADKVTNSNTTTATPLDFNITNTNSYTIDAIVPSVSNAIQSTKTQTTSVPSTRAETTTSTTSTTSSTTQTPTTTTVHVTHSALYACELLTHQSNTAFANSNNCYELVTQHKTFQVAEDDCMSRGGHLAHIKNGQEQQFLTTNANHYLGDHYIWIGLHDTAHEEQFVWTSGEPVSYTHWYPGRKNILIHSIEDCVAFKMGNFVHAYDGAWEDLPCNRAHAYICQFDLPSGSHIIG